MKNLNEKTVTKLQIIAWTVFYLIALVGMCELSETLGTVYKCENHSWFIKGEDGTWAPTLMPWRKC